MGSERLQPVRAMCDGVPVYGYGYTYIWGVSPTFIKGIQLQEGNNSPGKKIKPKKSWEIKDNKVGADTTLPVSALWDFQPQLSIRLIDGDYDTFWCSRPQNQPDYEPAWIRIDLAKESLIKAVVLVPREDNKGMPSDLTIKVSRDSWHWETAYQNPSYVVPEDTKPRVFSFKPVRAKQIWIIGRNLPEVDFRTYSFSVAEVEVIDETGDNLALASRGAGVTVSSTHYGACMRELQEMLWATQYDLGLKWVRVAFNGRGSVVNWHFVEQEKDKYAIDPRADEAVTECVSNGVNVVLCLGFTNWLYTPQGHRDPKQAKQVLQTQESWHGQVPGGGHGTLPSIMVPGMLEGYKNFVRFMVRYFKERVKYFEIWNEERTYFPGPKEYCQLVKSVVPIIREEAPEARILLGGMNQGQEYAVNKDDINLTPISERGGVDRKFLEACLKEGIGKLIDVIAWHPFYGADPESPQYRNYVSDVKDMKKLAESYGFRGEYHANEFMWGAPYPASNRPAVSELVKAKYVANLVLTHVGLDVASFFCRTWDELRTNWDLSLFRNTFSADPLSPQQPQAAYYVMRTLSTILDSVTPAQIDAEFSNREKSFETVGLKSKNGDFLLAVWIPGRASDDSSDIATDIIFPHTQFQQATGIDVLNGNEQVLQSSKSKGLSILKGMLIKDYPIVIKLHDVSK